MASYLRLEGVDMWHLAGWTMVHFLWLGALVGIAAAGCRLVLRRATPNARYIAAMVSLAVLAAMPLGIAAWIMQHPRTNLRLESSIAARDTATRGDLVNNEANERFSNNMALRSQTAPAAPGSAGGLIEGDERFASLSARPSRGLPGELLAWPLASIVNWLESCIVYLPWIWFLGTPLTLVLLATGIVGTKRLRLASQPVAAGPLTEMSSRLAKSLRVGQRVMIATCDRVCAPVLVGILRPMILLPPAALTGWSPDEIEMVLLHELAHVRRWDNLVNLLQRLVESLLFFHPVVWMVSTWMRRDRESCCDAIVVTCTRRPHAYAELLVALAAQMPRSVLFHPAASSAMAAGPLRNRIRRILQLEDDAMLISGKSFAVVLAGLLSAATLVVLYLPTRGQAEESAAEVTEYTEQSEENAESADVAEEASENETKVDAPTDQAASDAEDDWLRAAEFASRKEHEIAQRAWEELGIKAVPLNEAELEGVRRGGFRGGLKLIGLEDVMNTQGPLILTHIQSKSLATGIGDFASLERALDALASQPPDELLVLQGIKPRGGIFQYSMRRPQEKSAQSTIADAPNADGQAKPESVDAAVDNGPSRRVEVEQLRVGDEDVIVFRGARDNVDTFVKKLKDGENREPQKERRVLGTFTSDNDGLEKLVRAVDEARGKNLYVDIITKGTEWSLVVVPEPTEAEWPAMLGDPPRKERVIADKAW
ncbi:MAG TPA: M56 family metallopeptidase, partial [Lacipirellulaceae bacterium]|nr:M56 family metallopeptidase [Lacipirellulaceae bacterium]